MNLPNLTVGVSFQYKLRLPRILFSLLHDIFLNDCLVHSYGRDKISTGPDAVSAPVYFLEEREFFLQLFGGIALDNPYYPAHWHAWGYGD